MESLQFTNVTDKQIIKSSGFTRNHYKAVKPADDVCVCVCEPRTCHVPLTLSSKLFIRHFLPPSLRLFAAASQSICRRIDLQD